MAASSTHQGNSPVPTTILVIEDEELVRRSIAALLGVHGLRVLLAPTGNEGLQKFQELRSEIDVVLLDVTLPDIDGLEILDQLRQQDPQVRVILTSGYGVETFAQQLQSKPNVLFLQKPSPTREIIAKINQLLGRT